LLRRFPGVRPLFFRLLHLLLLRSWWVRRELRRLIKERSLQTVLDAGTGFGQYSHWLWKHLPGAEITSVDLKKDYLDELRRWYAGRTSPPRFEVRDLLELDYADMFELILNVDVMEHIEDDQRVFLNFHRALRKDGVLLLHTPALSEEADAAVVEAFTGEHVRPGYKHSEIARKLENAGFAKIRIRPTYGFWGGLAWKLLLKIPLRLLHHSRFWWPVLLFWYPVMVWPALAFMWLELLRGNREGGCLLLTAVKP